MQSSNHHHSNHNNLNNITVPLNEEQMLPKIIINADDYGYSWERCRGIIELIKQKCISSISVIINTPDIEGKCKMLMQEIESINKRKVNKKEVMGGWEKESNKMIQTSDWINPQSSGLSIGLHLNLTQFRQCSDCQHNQIPITHKQTQIFKGKSFIYDNLHLFAGNRELNIFIQSEIRSQIQKFIKIFKCKPTHIDGHNHIHIIPQIAENLCNVAKLYGIYKVRMPIPYKIHESIDENLNKFNQKFIKLAKHSKKIYDRYGFLYPDFMLGLDTIGLNFTSQNISFRLKEILLSIPIVHQPNTVIEIMIHPGYKQQQNFSEYYTCPFSKSSQRQFELKILKSQQMKEVVKNNLISYMDLKNNKKSEKSVLIYSKLMQGCGNLTTSLRLAKILKEQLKFKVYFADEPTSEEEDQIERIRLMIQQLGIKLVLGVNLTRTAWIIYQATRSQNQQFGYKVPYILVIAGTDANSTLSTQHGDQNKLKQINQSIKNCECLVSISEEMRNKIVRYLEGANIVKDIVVIVQSTLNSKKCEKQVQCLPTSVRQEVNYKVLQVMHKQENKPYIIFPTSFRKVKAVHHILPQLNKIIEKYSINVYILGPIINKEYYQKVSPQLGRVKYLGCISHEKYLNSLKNAMILINTSENQGMSCSILEAFAQKIPVIVRKNQGNCQLVCDGVNGFIYSTGEEFLHKFQYIFSHYEEIKNKICFMAYENIEKNFNYNKEVEEYRSMLEKYYEPLTFILPLPNIYKQQESKQDDELFLMNLKDVHPISPINLKIFQKFFVEDSKRVKACEKYFNDIIGNQQKEVHILDICCGNGIFCIYLLINLASYLLQTQFKIKIHLYFADIHLKSLENLKINLRTFEQFLQSKYNNSITVVSSTIVQSNMFQQINGKFDVILANLPQFPFRYPETRLDKNGGQDGIKLVSILLQNYSKYLKSQSSYLMILYSYIQDPLKFKELLQQYSSKIEWKGEPQVHEAKKSDLQKMEKGIAKVVEERMRQGKSEITMHEDLFSIPAELRIIKPKI